MDRDPTFYCNGSVITFPNTFRVRKYDNDLNYTTHNILRYHTADTHTFIYRMTRSTESVTVRITKSEIIAQNDRLGNHKYMRFSLNTPIPNIVCEMLSKHNSLVILDNTTIIDTPLF